MVGARGQPVEGCFPWDGIHVPICATVRTIPLCTTNCIYIIFWRTKVSLLVKVDGAYRLTTLHRWMLLQRFEEGTSHPK